MRRRRGFSTAASGGRAQAVSAPPIAPPIRGLRETALYTADMPRAADFFGRVLGLRAMVATDRLTAFDAGAGGVLLVFPQGGATTDVTTAAGTIPGHDGGGPLHMAFAIAAEAYEQWREHLTAQGVAIRAKMTWPAGGRSLYFDDPDGHVLELATPGLWANDGDLP